MVPFDGIFSLIQQSVKKVKKEKQKTENENKWAKRNPIGDQMTFKSYKLVFLPDGKKKG